MHFYEGLGEFWVSFGYFWHFLTVLGHFWPCWGLHRAILWPFLGSFWGQFGSHWHRFGVVLTTSPHWCLQELMWRFLHYFCSLTAGSCPPASSGLRQNGNLEEFCRSTHNALEFPRQIMMILHKEKINRRLSLTLDTLRCIIVFFELNCDA